MIAENEELIDPSAVCFDCLHLRHKKSRPPRSVVEVSLALVSCLSPRLRIY